MSTTNKKIGISLSGGGYRASAFHLGTLSKLHEMRILEKVDVVSTISGGSITGACYCINKKPFGEFYDDLYNGLQKKNVIKGVLLSWIGLRFLIFILLLLGAAYFLFTNYAWVYPLIIIGLVIVLFKYQFNLFPISKRIEQLYDKFFYEKKTLGELNHKPNLVIGSTNLQTAKPFSFSKYWMQDSTYQFMDDPIKFKARDFPISRAVIASSSVPFAFTPVTIDRMFFEDENEFGKVHPILVDGGVYDNQGIHKVMQAGQYACDIVVTSDAGCGSSGELLFKNTFSVLLETVNVFMSRIKKSQMVRNVYDNASTVNKEVAYFSLGWDIENCISGFIKNLSKGQITDFVIKKHELKPEWVMDPLKYEMEMGDYLRQRVQYDKVEKPTTEEKRVARSVGTNLTALSKKKVDSLIKQARALTEIQVKLYCPSSIN